MDAAGLARELLASYSSGTAIPAQPSALDPAFDLNAAYAVEAEFQRLRAAAGHGTAGRKVGFANKAMWRALKLETLVWAAMYDDTVHFSGPLPLGGMIAPRIEPEIVFKLKRDMPAAGLDAAGALEAVEWLALGFEIIDCPYPGWQFKPVDFVAAFGLHRALVVGEPHFVDAAAIPALVEQLPSFQLRLLRNGEFVEEGSGKNSLRSPALCLAELASAVLRRDSRPLAAGELVSTGTLTGAQSIAAGEEWRAEVQGLPVSALMLKLI